MKRRIATVVAALGLAAVLLPTTTSVANAAPAPMEPSARPMAQEFYWEWEDESDATSRTFRQDDYGSAGNLPRLIVIAKPARPQQFVKLQYKEDGRWRREDGDSTNSRGYAYLELNPICESGTWCNGTWKYRLVVNGKTTNFRITYRP